jgi:transcriptional regulator with XRE-family HTH domain
MTEGALFGPELRRRRMARGISLAQLAEQVHYSKGYLSKIETGLRQPTSTLARLCDNAVHGGGELSMLAGGALDEEPDRSDGTGVDIGSAYDAERWVMEMADDGSIWFQAVNRRHALFVGASALMTLSGALNAPRPGRPESSALDTFTGMFGQLRQLGQQTSPTLLLPTLIAQTHTMRSLATRASGVVRDRSLRLAARYAEYTGWMTQEAGRDRDALWWTDLAVSLAQAGADQELAAYSLVRRALITMYAGDGEQTVALAQQVREHRAAGPRVLGLAAQREAQGHALLGNDKACRIALDQADDLLTSAEDTEPATMLGSSSVANPAALTRAWCLHDLGKPGEAALVFDRELAGVAPGRSRFQARWGLRRALSYASSGEIEHACELTEPLLADIELVESATMRRDLHELSRKLSRHLNRPAVQAVFPALTGTLCAAQTRDSA